MDFDLIIKNATIVTATEILQPGLCIGIKSGIISAVALSLPTTSTTQIIDAEGAYVTPGGVDSHVHLHQDNAPTGDKWLSGSRAALAGGNTTILAFATQKRDDTSLVPVVEEYHRRAAGKSYVDYGFHLILTRPSEAILQDELPRLVSDEGISSVKLYMTYPAMKLQDGEMLEVLMRTRQLGMTAMIHAENSDMIDMITTRLLSTQHHSPDYHAVARPQLAETEATYRAIALSTLTDTPILIVHMSSPVAIAHARKAQSKLLLPVHAETCPHYLHLLSERLAATSISFTSPRADTKLVVAGESSADADADADANADLHERHVHHALGDGWAGASHVCAPPLRHSEADLQAVWDGVHNGTITVISSDHAPSRYNSALGKRKPVAEAQKAAAAAPENTSGSSDLPAPSFAQIPNGLPGIETRLPLLFSAATATATATSLFHSSAPTTYNPYAAPAPAPSPPSNRTLSLPKFVELTSTNPARLYGLSGRKGSIAPGYDADIVIWYPSGHQDGTTVIENRMLHHAIDYTPFEGMRVTNWPRYVLLRGRLKWDRDVELKGGIGEGLLGRPGDGVFLKRGLGHVLVGRVGQNPQGMREGERAAWMDGI
ncbi:uncharacterized protein A1O9_01638 [Exophiala aquamarina CBS 119918]|uniref:dihydropyrimidinase n=1 Tax=Exophiala aquamarina CBS 119918 TaxID=1182545 RepID=A0A072Q6U5_9EURO|nr:uncharacterized protein A1O9_01638 [Exophiala aquamarina CBS 119918]KEF63660.1 hypothetical protein A1O9_01638 [Exophiala aquamarina CBS 119918]